MAKHVHCGFSGWEPDYYECDDPACARRQARERLVWTAIAAAGAIGIVITLVLELVTWLGG